MEKANSEIRKRMHKHELRFWQLADALEVSEATLTRLFRHELKDEQRARILKAIEYLEAEKEGA